MDMAKRIEKARQDAGLSQPQLAEAAGVRYQSVQKWEYGKSQPKRDRIRKIAEACGVSPEWLEFGEHAKDEAGKYSLEAGPPVAERKAAPIVGTVEGGPDQEWFELGHPPGYGDEVVMAASTDPDAYALRVSGNSMAPRMRPGEAVLVEPNHECQPGDEVVLGLRGGDRMVKEFVYQRRGRIGLDSIADHQERIEVAEEEVAFMHYVAGVFRVGSIRKRE